MKDNQVQLDSDYKGRGGGVVTLALILSSLVSGQLTVQFQTCLLQWNLDLAKLYNNEFLRVTNDFL